MTKVINLFLLVTCCLISLSNCKLGAYLDDDYSTATLKCMVSQGITNTFIV